MDCPTCGRKIERAGQCPRCDEEGATLTGLEAVAAPVDLVAGRFELKSLLGNGSAGVVYRARDLGLGIEVALKLLRSFTPADMERLKREMLVGRRIKHPNVIRIVGFGVSGSDAWIAMELLEGGSLADRISAEPVPLDEASWTSLWVAQGLKAVHEAGIVHRDVKPGNVLFDLAGRPKLGDFGLARIAGSAKETAAGAITGTPLYLSPEMAGGGEATARSDVYSLGALLFELFSGRPPFPEGNLLKLIDAHLHQLPPRLGEVRGDVTRVVEEVVMECLRKEPRDRPTSTEVVSRLSRFLEAEEGSTGPMQAVSAPRQRRAGPAVTARSPLPSQAKSITVPLPPVAPPPPGPSVKVPQVVDRAPQVVDTLRSPTPFGTDVVPPEPTDRSPPAKRARSSLFRFAFGVIILLALAAAGYEWARGRPFP